MAPRQFVCAFRGARDRYQAAVALAEADLLDRLITDAYAGRAIRGAAAWLPPRLARKVAGRSSPDLPDALVDSLWMTTAVEHTRHALGMSPRRTWLDLDRRFSEAAADRARRSRADLFLYSPYAWEAFVASYPHTPRRVLFQYHPHPALEAQLLAADAVNHPGIGESFAERENDDVPEAWLRRERDSWRHADAVICSSAFTRRSLVEAGCDERICHVVPYGVELPSAPAAVVEPAEFRVLFVGSGGQRKGLHHLLLAWQRSGLGSSGRLTLVCRAIDRGIERMASTTPGVELRRGASAPELDALFAGSVLFVMPSMVEGFGHVYLEALARGCPVLGTPNSGLPDIGGEADGVFVTAAADIEALTARLVNLSQRRPELARLRSSARAAAARYPWSAFRSRLREVVVQ